MAKEIPFHTIEFLHLLMEAVPHMLFVVDSDMRVFHVNSAASRKLHIDGREVYMHRGGEEFLVMVTNNTRDNAGHFAEKLRSLISNYDFHGVGRVTCSFGVAQLTGDENEDQLVERVDKALYQAKAAGRNRVETA